MRIRCPFSFCNCFSFIFICFFLIRGLQLFFHLQRSDYRVDIVGLINSQPFEGDNPEMYLRKIQNRLKMENFELIQMMNETNPNIISDDAVLVISASHGTVENSYAHLIQKIQKSNIADSRIPFYLMRKAKSLLMQNSESINQQIYDIAKILQYFTESLLIKRLTILSFEEGSLFCLRALAYIKYDAFSIIDKLILINPFNPTIGILHGNSQFFLEETKKIILQDPVRTELTNGTRIIIIHTTDNNPGDQRLNWIFKNSAGENVTFANSIVVQSKLIWNVYSYLKPSQYFRFEPFLQILTKLIHEDRQSQPLTIKEINYLLLYREILPKKQLPLEKRSKILVKCVDFYMENYSYEGNSLNFQCIRILRKQDFYFNENTAIIIRSFSKFQLYGENYEKIMPYQSTPRQTLYLLQNVLQYKRVFIINSKRSIVNILVQSVIKPRLLKYEWKQNLITNDAILSFKQNIGKNLTQLINFCPGQAILYPLHLLPIFYDSYFHFSPQFSLENTLDCYFGIDMYVIILRNLTKYWGLGFNLIMFSLFCFHVISRGTFSRLYHQLFFNYILTYLHTGQSMFTQNAIIIGIVIVIEQIIRFAGLMSDMIYLPKQFSKFMILLPISLQVLRLFSLNIFFSPWKGLALMFFTGATKANITIFFLKLIYIHEYVIRDVQNIQSLLLCCFWIKLSSKQLQICQKKEENSQNMILITTGRRLRQIKQKILNLRKQIVDTITVCFMAMCLEENGIIFHHIINFYMVTFVIFALHQNCVSKQMI